MHGYINRLFEKQILEDLDFFPVVAIIGPRQCGKSTLAQFIGKSIDNFMYLDLESHRDLNKLEDPEYFFEINAGKTVCLDEIQRKPELFPVLRSIVDRDKHNTRILLLGSASPELIKHSSETLAGRISYIPLSPFSLSEISSLDIFNLQDFWLCGGFPRSFLYTKMSFRWRENFIKTFLERDMPLHGIAIPALQVRRFLTMCAHSNGQVFNASKIGESLGLSHTTVKKYIDIFEQTYLIRTVQPYFKNVKKRLIKSPKIYIRDTGILHALLSIKNFNDLLGHPIYGASWESFCIENILSEFTDWEYSFYRTSNGAELDLIIEKGDTKIGIEFKVSTAPKIQKGFWHCLEDLDLSEAYIITPLEQQYTISDATVIGLNGFLEKHK
jgi:predicted AAA+ superfamily ATPase